MAEELSPESKLYVKEEIEKLSNEFKQDIKEAQSKATKTFTAVALIIGLLASVGVLSLAKDHANKALSNTTIKTLETKANELKDSCEKSLSSCEESLSKAKSCVAEIESLTEKYGSYKIDPIYRYYDTGPYREICVTQPDLKDNWKRYSTEPYFYVFVKKPE